MLIPPRKLLASLFALTFIDTICLSLCCLQKAELVEKQKLTVFPGVFWSAVFVPQHGCVQRQGCMEPIVSLGRADWLPDVVAHCGCQLILFPYILPGPHLTGKHSS